MKRSRFLLAVLLSLALYSGALLWLTLRAPAQSSAAAPGEQPLQWVEIEVTHLRRSRRGAASAARAHEAPGTDGRAPSRAYLSAVGDAAAVLAACGPRPVTYATDVAPLLQERCTRAIARGTDDEMCLVGMYVTPR
jgi:hypothetical protein